MGQGKRIRTESKRGGYTENKHNKTKSNKFSLILKILTAIFVIITIMFYIAIIKMNLLPGLYVTIFTVAEIIFTVALAVGMAKKHETYKLNIFCLIVAIIISIVYVNATRYAMATMDFLGTVFTEVTETEEYYIVTRKSSNLEKIDDLKDVKIYTFQSEDDVKDEIEKKVNSKIEEKSSLKDLGNDLIKNNLNAILISSTQYDILDEEIKDFKLNTKIIHKATHNIEVKETISDNNSKHTIENQIFNVYISGIDTSGSISKVSRSDANIVATINTKTHEVLLTSIPRDYYVTLHSKKAKDKLTHSGIYGINETVKTVEDLLNIDINYYVRVNFTTVIKLVDTLGGIDVYSDYSFTTFGYHFDKGYNHVNGEEALVFSRERHSFAAGDNQRVKNQQHVIEAIIKKVMNSKTILTKYTNILNSLEGCFQTNIEQSDISNLVKDQLNNMTSWTVKTNALTGSGDSRSTYSMGSQKLYVMIPNSTSVQNAKSKIREVIGE